MKETKVETLIYYSKLTFDKEHIANDSHADIQQILNEYNRNGYRFVSSSTTGFGAAVYIYLFFEKEI
jgi:hypothetical protein